MNSDRRGPPLFRIQGELHHRSGSLLPSSGHVPTYSQLYVYEPREALANGVRNNPSLRQDTMATLQAVILTHNRHAQVYKHAFEILRCVPSETDAIIKFRVAPGRDRRTHNLPTADEVAVIMPGDTSAGNSRDIVLSTHDGPLHLINERHPSYVPLQYPLAFPYGEPGWQPPRN